MEYLKLNMVKHSLFFTKEAENDVQGEIIIFKAKKRWSGDTSTKFKVKKFEWMGSKKSSHHWEFS